MSNATESATESAIEAIEQAMQALTAAKQALLAQGQTKPAPAVTAPQQPKEEPEIKRTAARAIPRWIATKTGKSCLRHPSNGNVTIMPDRLHPDQICLLFNLNGEEGVKKFYSMPEARQAAEQMLGF